MSNVLPLQEEVKTWSVTGTVQIHMRKKTFYCLWHSTCSKQDQMCRIPPYRVPSWTKWAHPTGNQNLVERSSDCQAEPFKFDYSNAFKQR